MAYIPLILALAGTAQQVSSNIDASRYNAQVTQQEQKISVNQAAAQEALVRRSGRQAIGKQVAAFGSSGAGYGGSSETAIDSSAVNAELDALNTRYRGSLTGYGYGVQSQLDNSRASSETWGGSMLAGAKLLQGLSGTYTTGPSPAAMAGLQTPGGSMNLG